MSDLAVRIWKWGYSVVTDAIDDIQELLDKTQLNKFISHIVSIPDHYVNHVQMTNLNILNNDYTIQAPVNQDLTKTPTVEMFLSAANTTYTLTGKPWNLSPFLVNGEQVSIIDEITGMAAEVWKTDKNQLIIAFQGTTGGDNLLLNPALIITQVMSDLVIMNQSQPLCFDNSLKFTQYVVHEAELQGYTTNDIFLTGHSLGGTEASYVAQKTGLGGVSFESYALSAALTGNGNGSNFVSVETYGDPWGQYGSDTMPNSPLVTETTSIINTEYNHYGKVVQLGSLHDQARMESQYAHWGSSVLGNLVDFVKIIDDFFIYHLPITQARNMGITDLYPYSLILNTISTQHGPIAPIGQNTIQQALDYVPVQQYV